MTERPGDYTMAWDCRFNLDGKTEAITFLTDDFETVLEEYNHMKLQHKVCIFVSHELKTKAKMLVSAEMLTSPAMNLPGDAPPIMPVVNADDPHTPQRVRNAINRGDLKVVPDWMDEHNRKIAERHLKEPDRI